MDYGPEAGHGANGGLAVARSLLDPVKAQFPSISYADLYTLAGVVAIEEMGGPTIPWAPGRSDAPDGSSCPPDGRLPDAALGAGHVRDIFYRMGFDDREIVALSGAHTLGRCHGDRSGFVGPWTNAPTTFSSLYFQVGGGGGGAVGGASAVTAGVAVGEAVRVAAARVQAVPVGAARVGAAKAVATVGVARVVVLAGACLMGGTLVASVRGRGWSLPGPDAEIVRDPGWSLAVEVRYQSLRHSSSGPRQSSSGWPVCPS